MRDFAAFVAVRQMQDAGNFRKVTNWLITAKNSPARNAKMSFHGFAPF